MNHQPKSHDDDEAQLNVELHLYHRNILQNVHAPADVWERLMPQLGAQQVPVKRRLWLSRLSRPPVLSLQFAGVLAVVICVLINLIPWSTSVSAQEIAQRAHRALNTTSFEGILTFTAHGESGEVQRTEQRVWFRAPYARRIEIHTPVTGLDTPAGPVEEVIVTDGNVSWQYSQKLQRVLIGSAWDMQYGPTTFDVVELEALLDAARIDYEPRLIGKEQLAGRDCYILELRARSEAKGALAPRLKIWVDDQTFVTLGQERQDQNGHWFDRWTYMSIQYDVALDPTLFTFQPPAGVQVQQTKLILPSSSQELTGQWRQVAEQAPFTVFRPTYVPDSLIAWQPVYNDRGVIQVYKSDTGEQVLALHETLTDLAALPEAAEIVPVNQGRAWYQQYSDFQSVFIQYDDTYITLQAPPDFSKEELLKVAHSFQPVPNR